MNRGSAIILFGVLVSFALISTGCKGKVEKTQEAVTTEAPAAFGPMDEMQGTLITEPAQTVASEMIPPTAAPPGLTERPIAPLPAENLEKTKDIQRALANANFYAGAIDGKIGPKTKRAIEAFQSAKGLKVDGKVGPKTWAELEKYLIQR